MPKLPKFPLSQAFGVSVPRIDSVPNHVFTHNYTQIEDYHFCQDSVIFPWFVAQHFALKNVSADFRTLDLCAGCGVIGLELAYHLPTLKNLDFIEVQSVFRSAFLENVAKSNEAWRAPIESGNSGEDVTNRNFAWREMNYDSLLLPAESTQYDLIISNPPYFFQGDGRPAENGIKNRCRFFVDSDLKNYVAAICTSLRLGGCAFFLCKLGGTHGRRSWDQIRLGVAAAGLESAIVADIRGTAVVKITLDRP